LTLGLCTTALNALGAVVIATGLGAFDLASCPPAPLCQNALDTLRISSAIASVEPNRILIGSASYPQTWHFPAIDRPATYPAAGQPCPSTRCRLDTGVAYESFGPYKRRPYSNRTAFAPGWDFVHGDRIPTTTRPCTAMATIIADAGDASPPRHPLRRSGPRA